MARSTMERDQSDLLALARTLAMTLGGKKALARGGAGAVVGAAKRKVEKSMTSARVRRGIHRMVKDYTERLYGPAVRQQLVR